jgi:threonine synthase
VQIRGSYDDAMALVRKIADNFQVSVINSINRYRIEGQKTAAIEIWRHDLGRAPDYHCIPVGNAGNIFAYWKGYTEYREHLLGFEIEKVQSQDPTRPRQEIIEEILARRKGAHWRGTIGLPKMMGYQAAGASPIVLGQVVEDAQTFATAIRIGNPTHWDNALRVLKESGSKVDSVTDEEIEEAYLLLPRLEGVFCEPASAACVAGLVKSLRTGDIQNTEETVIVCTLTGHGLKDPDSPKRGDFKSKILDADLGAIARFLKL